MKKNLSFLLITLLFSLLFVGKVSAQSSFSVKVVANPNEGGVVWVSDNANATYNNKTEYTSNSSAGITFPVLGTIKQPTPTKPAYIFARPNDNYKFIKWTNSNGETVSSNPANDARLLVGEELSHDSKTNISETYTAHFEQIVKLDATFHSVEGGGKYTVTYSYDKTESKNLDISNTTISHQDIEDMGSIKLIATPDDNYRFLRWRVEYSDPQLQPQYYNKPETEINVSKSFTLYCEFISSDFAQFILHGSSENSYLKLSDAIVAAQQGPNKVIVVNNSGKLYNEKDKTAAIPNVYEPSTNTYTIPSDVTLVVPGDSKHTYKTANNQLMSTDFVYDDTSNNTPMPFQEYCVFTIPENVKLNFLGDLCVYASLSCNGSFMGQPRYYGQIHLCDGAEITLNKIAYIFGYITGDYKETKVSVTQEASVYEVLQIRDWRGGTGTANMLDNQKRVFPIKNYFVQNIETNLVLNAGAHEYVCTGVEMTKADILGALGGDTETIFATVCWVAPKDASSALIKLGDNTRLEKYFDREKNRLIIDIISEGNKTVSQFDHVEIKLGDYEMISSKYVFPITPNLSVNLINTHTEVLCPLEFLAGSYLSIDQNSKLDASEADIYVYDEAENTVSYDGANGKIAPGFHGYFCSNNQPLFNLGVYPTSPGNPDVGSKVISDACVDVNGELIGKIITTYSGASIISSSGTGKVSFTGLPAKPTYQVLQWHNGRSDNGLVWMQIQTNSSATLLNADGSYSAGNGEEDNYKYYPFAPNEGSDEKGRWLSEVPSGSVGWTVDGKTNEIDITIPEKITDIVVSLTPNASDLTINSIAGIDIEGTHFSKQSVNSYNYNPETGQIDVTLQYDPHKSNVTVTERLLITLNCTNTTTGLDVDVLAEEVMLIAREDYTPAFKVNDTENKAEITLGFTAEVGKESEGQIITITPIPGNVSDKQYKEKTWYVKWEPSALSVNSPFIIEGNDYFDGVTVKYKPETMLPPHNQTLTITARYDENTYTTKTINLQGTPSLAPNQLAFIANEKIIFPGDEINPLFSSKGNQTKIEYTYNGQPTNDNVVVEIDNDNNSLRVKSGAHIIEQQEIIIVAAQNENDKTGPGHSIMKVIVKPSVQWNWSDLYFDNVYTDPIVVQGGGDYTLTLKDGCGELIDYNEITKSIVIGNGSECTAIFEYKKGDYSLDLESFIYQNPRIIPMCVNGINATRIYKGITTSVTTDNSGLPLVTYDGGILFATTASSSASWTFALIGIPDKLQFIPTGNKEWTIYESVDGNSWGVPTLAKQTITIPTGEIYFTHQLKTTTKYIRIVCDLGDEDGKITELCVTELSDAANSTTNIVYLPITKDADGEIIASQESLTIQYVSVDNPLSLVVKDDDGNAVEGLSLSSNTLNATTVTDPSSQETITITNNSHSTDETLYLVVLDNKDEVKLSIPIRMYHYPQSLPMRSADWTGDDAEKYHFYKVQSQYVSFDNSTQEVVFQPSGNSQRFVTFAFKGGPSYIQFETTTKLTNENWSDNWTVEVYDGTHYQVINETPEITPILVGETTYYRVRVAIPYTSKKVILANNLSVSPEKIRNVIIDGEPDLDVQTGNHTIEHTAKYNFTTTDVQNVVVTAINLEKVKVRSTNSNFIVKFGETTITSEPTTLDITSCPGALGSYEVGNITFSVAWAAKNAIDEGLLIFTDNSNKELASVRLLGTKSYITADNADDTNMFTGFARNITSHPFMTNFAENDNYKYDRRVIDLSNTFALDGTALFDYLIVYGETSTTDNTNIVTAPTGANLVDGVPTGKGSNAKTPYYIYRKALNSEGNKYDRYQIVFDAENANVADKAALETAVDANGQLIPHAQDQGETKCIQLAEGENLKVYVTGFCPYATTGFKKEQEGVWLFRGKPTAKLDLYLEDCHIYSRNKTDIGCGAGKFDFDYIFQEDYARGSGGVFVFECNSEGEFVVPEDKAFEVTIHTLGKNVLKSNFGCFYQIWGMRAYQVSSPIQIRVSSKEHVNRSRTILTFDDKWPTGWETEIKGEETITKLVTKRTNGFLSLQKQSNNAPSIDLGNPLTVVHFRGGQVELQNAQNVSDKYKTTLAISYRSGIMAAGGVELQMARGIGTDDATQGKVYFHDGTTTVIPMYVNPDERKYYLMDPQIDQNGDTIKDANGDPLDSDITSCLRCPEQTYVRGGSICMLRACMSPTSKGGAPTDGYERLGRFFYTPAHGYTYNTSNGATPDKDASAEQWLVKPTQFPGNSKIFDNLVGYYTSKGYSYGVESVTPDKNNKLTLWIPEGYGGSEAEYDQKLTAWKTCMTYVHATIAMGYAGEIGGNAEVESDEDVTNLLYCHLDDYTHHVISDHTGDGDNADYSYEAPVKIPDGFSMEGMEEIGGYLYLKPDNVGGAVYEMLNENDYKITKKIYYITTALADTWMNFTAPFDVENIYVVESYNESKLQNYFNAFGSNPGDEDIELPFEGNENYVATRLFQGKHNADFASFFGMAMALGSEQTFEQIKDDYLEWAYLQDATEPANGGEYYQGTKENYNWRGIYPLTHYDGSNFMNSHFFLYQNTGEWIVDNSLNNFLTQWTLVPQKDGNVLLHQGETYSMLFPHSWGFDDKEEQGSTWDYWTGKYLIFESTSAPKNTPHIVAGRRTALETLMTKPVQGTASLSGNASFAKLKLDAENANIALYKAAHGGGNFEPYKKVDNELPIIYPATSYLHMNMGGNQIIQRILRTGEIIYETTGSGTTTGGNMPTIGGGNDLFITETAGGINVAVTAPQQVRVISSTGAVLYSGMVQTSVDVAIPTTGVYVVAGENEVQKILY